jgi:hypothetical protein
MSQPSGSMIDTEFGWQLDLLDTPLTTLNYNLQYIVLSLIHNLSAVNHSTH